MLECLQEKFPKIWNIFYKRIDTQEKIKIVYIKFIYIYIYIYIYIIKYDIIYITIHKQ